MNSQAMNAWQVMRRGVAVTAAVLVVSVSATRADDAREAVPAELRARAENAIDRGLAYLRSTQEADGAWTADFGPAVTAIVAEAFVRDAKHGPKHAIVTRAAAGVLKYQQTDGGIYERQRNLGNYQTSVALMLLADMDKEKYREPIQRAQRYLRKIQFDGDEEIVRDHAWYGGAGYNERKRPDLSNTQMMIEALHRSGLPADDPIYKRAMVFVSRCQMLDATNDLAFADGARDGGFIYSPNAGGESKASEHVMEGDAPLRSYGSMTYAGFKSMLYANVGRDDRRIQAAFEWIRRNYTLERNAGMPDRQAKEGLYYYYYVFSKALDAWGEPVITDVTGKRHAWRAELCEKLIALQRPDGSWVNDEPRWLESNPNYVTAMAIRAMQTALGADGRGPVD